MRFSICLVKQLVTMIGGKLFVDNFTGCRFNFIRILEQVCENIKIFQLKAWFWQVCYLYFIWFISIGRGIVLVIGPMTHALLWQHWVAVQPIKVSSLVMGAKGLTSPTLVSCLYVFSFNNVGFLFFPTD